MIMWQTKQTPLADLVNGLLWRISFKPMVHIRLELAVRDHVSNWLQLLIQTPHCGWLYNSQTSFLNSAELLEDKGVFAEARGELLSARDPDLWRLSTSGVGSEVDSDVRWAVLLWNASHKLICEGTLKCQVSAAPSFKNRLLHET